MDAFIITGGYLSILIIGMCLGMMGRGGAIHNCSFNLKLLNLVLNCLIFRDTYNKASKHGRIQE